MRYVLIIFIGFLVISLLYYLSNPGNHNAINGGNGRAYNPKTKEGKKVHEILETTGLLTIWLIVIMFVIVTLISIFL